ncbi:hypothetical protein ACSBR2_013104 [Camellia fascicularis]
MEVIHDSKHGMGDDQQDKMPLLVYVSREKRPSHPYCFKAGALNALVPSSFYNIEQCPYVLVLDCDMYSNDPTSARQAMCFHLDPEISCSLALLLLFNILECYTMLARSTY